MRFVPILNLTLTLILALTFGGPLAADSGGGPPNYPPIKILEVLAHLNSGDPYTDRSAMEYLDTFDYQEVFDEVLKRLEMEVYRGFVGHGLADVDREVVETALTTLLSLAARSNPDFMIRPDLKPAADKTGMQGYIVRLSYIYRMIELYPGEVNFQNQFLEIFRILTRAMDYRQEPMESLFEGLRRSPLVPEDAALNFRSSMAKMQDMIVEALENPTSEPPEAVEERILRLLRSKARNEKGRAERAPLRVVSNREQKSAADGKQIMVRSVEDSRETTHAPLEMSPSELKRHLARMRDALETSIIEQPEVIDFLLHLETQDKRYGRENSQDSKPPIILLMGLPGGGKDTTAEAYTRALHHNKEDWDRHLFRLPIASSEGAIWQILGSATGYRGSENFPPFLEFLVRHSAGRYEKVQVKKPSGNEFKVVENPKWQPGMVLEGYFAPEQGVVFANELHNWSRANIDTLLKQAFEKGIFTINNPNGGVNELRVPITFIAASNDGIELVSSRKKDGTRYGLPLSYEDMMAKWRAVHGKVDRLKKSIQKPVVDDPRNPRGISEEVANRLRHIFLLRPLSPEGLRTIAELKLQRLAEKLKKIRGGFGEIRLSWTPNVPKFVQQYQYLAEDNARPIDVRVEHLIQKTIDDALNEDLIKPDRRGQVVLADVVPNGDGTFNLSLKIHPRTNPNSVREISVFIRDTMATKDPEPLTADQRTRLFSLAERMKQKLFGLDDVVDRISKSIIVAENQKHVNTDKPGSDLPIARRFAFFGISSTGKTEMAKVLAEELYGDRDAVVTFSFSNIKNELDFKKYFGGVPGREDEPSKFMLEYDRRNGQLIFILDEIDKCPASVLTGLYDFFREGQVTEFNDGETRKMGGVTFIITGNVGEEWYRGIPAEVPELERMTSMLEIYKRASRNTRAQELLLLTYFTEALLSRIGMENIYFFPPLNFKAIRQMFQLKFSQALQALRPGNGKEGWDVQFESREEYGRILDAFEYEGFKVSSQGASIGRFVKEDFTVEMNYLLQTKGIPSGTRVLVTLDEAKTYDPTAEFKGVYLKIQPEGHAEPLQLYIRGKKRERHLQTSDVDRVLTAYHEAGHELVRTVYQGDAYKPMGISVKPGVDWFGDRWIYYLGIARFEGLKHIIRTREAVVREMAGLAGGTMAQELVTEGARHDSGKSNDMERATRLAQAAILQWGLTPNVTHEVAPAQVSLNEYIKTLDARTFNAYREELQRMLAEARSLARVALLINYDHLVAMGKQLAQKGEMTGPEIEEFYEMREIKTERQPEFAELAQQAIDPNLPRDAEGYPQFSNGQSRSFRWFVDNWRVWLRVAFGAFPLGLHVKELVAKLTGWWQATKEKLAPEQKIAFEISRDAELLHPKLMPESIADIRETVKEIQRQGRAEAPPIEVPLLDADRPFDRSASAEGVGGPSLSCREVFSR